MQLLKPLLNVQHLVWSADDAGRADLSASHDICVPAATQQLQNPRHTFSLVARLANRLIEEQTSVGQ
jgi:hypothetical protein